MKGSKLLTVITVVYNGEKYIENTILSVINQSYQHIEYIIIDGGSTDNTLSIIEKYRRQITVVVSEKDRGISDAFNKGLRLAKGEMIGIINADDWYEKNTLEEIADNMEGADVLYGNMRFWSNEEVDFLQVGEHQLLNREMTINHPSVFIRRTIYEKFGLFDESYRYAMDYDLILRLWVNGCRFRHISKVLANMRLGGASDVNWKAGCRETLQIKNKYLPQHKWLNQLYYYKHIMAISIPKFLNKTPVAFIVKMYRSHYSMVKKQY
jgi:glycosyltransferase involved in cell wall biosynthesis